MTLLKKITKHSKTIACLSITAFMVNCSHPTKAEVNDTKAAQKINIALLLDTSNSMDGLIEQAKTQLWSMVNELAKAKTADNQKPTVQIALYEYGNSRLSADNGYIRMVSPLTDDLDNVSEALFGLKTSGGDEYCGQVIASSTTQLSWDALGEDLQIIFIAGNEPFTQGRIDYKEACQKANNKKIIINTIFCGDYSEGINTNWKAGADLTGGKYMNIEQNLKTVYLDTPFDDSIAVFNDRLNNTYIYYGQQGYTKKEMQQKQDQNSKSYGKGNEVNRVISKSKHVYKNSSWDLVDAVKDKSVTLTKVDKTTLPSELQKLTDAQLETVIKTKEKEREEIKYKIELLSKKREAYLAEKRKTSASGASMLDNVMISAIRHQAKAKGMIFEN